MAQIEPNELLDEAREQFINGEYSIAEPLLQQALLKNNRLPEIFQMLATIYYDQGKFNRAIKTFKRALEIDPGYTDASVGLSIILNDLGRYDEGREIFEKARNVLESQKSHRDPYIEEKLATKHLELGEIYFNYNRFDEALEQYFKAQKMSTRRTEITMKIAECFLKRGDAERAIKELRSLCQEYPQYLPARLRLGTMLYDSSKVAEAVEQWENVLFRDPENPAALRYLQLAQDAGVTTL
jgi:tetratricopeptide (TPR) repeat protein